MAKLKQILTHKYSEEELKELSDAIAEESEEEWITTEKIAEYNSAIDNYEVNTLDKILRFLFITHPYIGFLCVCLLPAIILLPTLLLDGMIGGVLVVFGLFIGFVIGSFIFPNLVSSCKNCGAIKKCDRIFSYSFETKEHTEKRTVNGVTYKYLITDELVFCIYECTRCKSRKIEVLILTSQEKI
ncbi:MAG: hypothetical protein IJD79_07400 [Clostridia bacterium]|nr:hypothetical protein [Clostridia bacterium]